MTSVTCSRSNDRILQEKVRVLREWARIFGINLAATMMMRPLLVPAVLIWIFLSQRLRIATAFSVEKDSNPPFISRRNLLWQVPVGAVSTYAYGRLLYNALSVRDIQYPEAHERRVESTISTALVAALPKDRPTLRVLEVGVGKDCRLLRRGLYQKALHSLAEHGIQSIEIVGVDLKAPSETMVADARERIRQGLRDRNTNVEITAKSGDITADMDYTDGSFDSIISCLTLCSVSDQTLALQNLQRLVRPSGGTFGYVEHVAVEDDEPYRFLALQQELLDPLQQALADNCHLHRHTEDAIHAVFGLDKGSARQVANERFLVDSMWPVTCQCCGVIQRTV